MLGLSRGMSRTSVRLHWTFASVHGRSMLLLWTFRLSRAGKNGLFSEFSGNLSLSLFCSLILQTPKIFNLCSLLKNQKWKFHFKTFFIVIFFNPITSPKFQPNDSTFFQQFYLYFKAIFEWKNFFIYIKYFDIKFSNRVLL